jgi:F-type H+-transporting ATPase subunit epsilon
MTLNVQVVTPKGTLSYAPVKAVILPGRSGKLEILQGHAPLLTCLDRGLIQIYVNNQWISIGITEGIAQVENNEVLVLVNEAVQGEQ